VLKASPEIVMLSATPGTAGRGSEGTSVAAAKLPAVIGAVE
jgi:hypothetical protein